MEKLWTVEMYGPNTDLPLWVESVYACAPWQAVSRAEDVVRFRHGRESVEKIRRVDARLV